MKVVLFEDEYVARLNPITLAKPAYAITCASYRLVDWLSQFDVPLHGIVWPHLRELQAAEFPELDEKPAAAAPDTLLVNARLVPSRGVFHSLKSLLTSPDSVHIRQGEAVAAALIRDRPALPPFPWSHDELNTCLRQVAHLPAADLDLPLLDYPHDVIRWNSRNLNENLEYRLTTDEYREIREGVFAGRNAQLGESCVTDTRQGPILLGDEATIGPFCYLSGPAYVGPHAKLIEHAAIKDGVSLGHTTKVGGEVESSVIEPFTNKQHHGFLGHSYLGSWINLGAGTCNSDLKNTYGNINMDYRGQRVATDMQFLGCIMGDYSKTAINTGIFTGKTIGVCSMLYGFVTSNVPSFVNYARLFGQVTELPPEVMIATQQRMFRRRGVNQRACDIQLIHDMYDLTREERQLGGEPLAF
jgi:glucose-1-phosphate thymidylyltransferase